MRVKWYGQSAFLLSAPEAEVFIDPFGPMEHLEARGMRFEYPRIEGVAPDLAIVTHEHGDHNRVDMLEGDPAVPVRSVAGTHESPIGEIVAVASEHDDAAGTRRGPNLIVVFTLDGLRVAHFGDFGQGELRESQRAAIGEVDLAFVPVGGGPTIRGEQAYAIATEIGAGLIVPMHYNTPRVSFLEPIDDFLGATEAVHQLETTEFDTGDLPESSTPLAVIPAAP